MNNWFIIIFILGCFAAWLHNLHIWTLFENDKHFSHLSSLERDLAFRTEMGLYYSYYKTIVEAPSFKKGLEEIIWDNVTEFPDTINVLKRFNLYPELTLGGSYRIFDALTKAFGLNTKQCWKVNRGELPEVISCEGPGDPHYFYVYCIYLLNSFMIGFMFVYGSYLSGNTILGGVLAVGFFFFNHGESTRVMWTPPLRESFSFPFLILELMLVTHMLKTEKPKYLQHMLSIFFSAFFFMLPWQFAQFALLTQTSCIFALYMLEYIGRWKINILLDAQLLALVANFVFQCGNKMLLTSFYASSLLSVIIIVRFESKIEGRIRNLILRCLFKTISWLVGTFVMKKMVATILMASDDEHIWEIFQSKFTDFNNFHTMLYTCAKEFDFLEISTVIKLTKTLLIPTSVFLTIIVAVKSLYYEYKTYKESSKDEEVDDVYNAAVAEHRSKPNPEILYNVLQMIAFSIMAILIMRLKLFMTPMMCITASLLANRKLFSFIKQSSVHTSLIVALFAVASFPGYSNLTEQWNIVGEFQNWPHEQLLTFINDNLPKEAVFAGAMPTTASIKLSCLRPIVNHPHYEDAGLRARTMKVYSMYSRQELSEVRDTLEGMKVDYYILENSWCVRKTREGCQMPQIWDIEQPEYKDRIPACATARNNPMPYFSNVYKNDVYTILKVEKNTNLT